LDEHLHLLDGVHLHGMAKQLITTRDAAQRLRHLLEHRLTGGAQQQGIVVALQFHWRDTVAQ
jgi:hypothetical protein